MFAGTSQDGLLHVALILTIRMLPSVQLIRKGRCKILLISGQVESLVPSLFHEIFVYLSLQLFYRIKTTETPALVEAWLNLSFSLLHGLNHVIFLSLLLLDESLKLKFDFLQFRLVFVLDDEHSVAGLRNRCFGAH